MYLLRSSKLVFYFHISRDHINLSREHWPPNPRGNKANRDLAVKAPFLLKQQEWILLREHYLPSNVLHLPIILVPITNCVILYFKFLAVCKAKWGGCSVPLPAFCTLSPIHFIYIPFEERPSLNESFYGTPEHNNQYVGYYATSGHTIFTFDQSILGLQLPFSIFTCFTQRTDCPRSMITVKKFDKSSFANSVSTFAARMMVPNSARLPFTERALHLHHLRINKSYEFDSIWNNDDLQ